MQLIAKRAIDHLHILYFVGAWETNRPCACACILYACMRVYVCTCTCIYICKCTCMRLHMWRCMRMCRCNPCSEKLINNRTPFASVDFSLCVYRAHMWPTDRAQFKQWIRKKNRKTEKLYCEKNLSAWKKIPSRAGVGSRDEWICLCAGWKLFCLYFPVPISIYLLLSASIIASRESYLYKTI